MTRSARVDRRTARASDAAGVTLCVTFRSGVARRGLPVVTDRHRSPSV